MMFTRKHSVCVAFLFVFLLNIKNTAANDPQNIFYPIAFQAHPLNVASSDLIHGFFINKPKSSNIQYHHTRANIWLPYTKAYLPINSVDKVQASNIIWHERAGKLDFNNIPSKTQSFHADGVYSVHHLVYQQPLKNRGMLTGGVKLFNIIGGKQPWTFLASDKAIEWFHSNVAGGEDPFARKKYSFDDVNVSYTNENNDTIGLDKQLYFSNLSLAYIWLPELWNGVYYNLQIQGAYNFIEWNRGFDFGVGIDAVKILGKEPSNHWRIQGAGELNFENLIKSKNHIGWKTNNLSWKASLMLSYVISLQKQRSFILGTGYDIQRAFVPKSHSESSILTGERYKSHWHYSYSHFLRPNSAHSIVFIYQLKRLSFSIYLKEDLWVHNAPDIQTGFSTKFDISNR